MPLRWRSRPVKSQKASSTNPSSQASLEGLPTELRVAILNDIPDPNTLHHLIQASPIYYHSYRSRRDEIWTRMTEQLLIARKIDILDRPVSSVQISLKDRAVPDSKVHRAVQGCYKQMQNGVPIKLTVQECKALLQISDSVGWKVVEIANHTAYKKRLWCSRPCFDSIRPDIYVTGNNSPGWRVILITDAPEKIFPMGVSDYHALCFGDQFGSGLVVHNESRNPLAYPFLLIGVKPFVGVLPAATRLGRGSGWTDIAWIVLSTAAKLVYWGLVLLLLAALVGSFLAATFFSKPQAPYSTKKFEPTPGPRLRYQGPLAGHPGIWSCTEKKLSVRAVYACQRIDPSPTIPKPKTPRTTIGWSWTQWLY